ncbi:MAG: acetyl-CoA carboxylase biotin carboxyl carrier protein [Erysipelotrichaceae bacterium]|nr:acetyl-CoA carboxylase biotin carboxyl carrier protein [Erysipelotrichaceae bacterium]
MMETENIRQIIEIFEKSQISSMDLEIGDMKIKLEKNLTVVSAPLAPVVTENLTVKETKSAEQPLITIDSPLVGTFYTAVKPGAKPFVEVGSKVKKGDVVCIIEAMKSMNEIKSDKDGVIKEVLVNDGDMVEYGQAMFVIGDVND